MEHCNINFKSFENITHPNINILGEMLLDEALQLLIVQKLYCVKMPLSHFEKLRHHLDISIFCDRYLEWILAKLSYKSYKTYCAKSKALSYYLDFMFPYKLELGRVTLGSEITWENWHSRCAQVHPTIMSMWTCFQKTNISIHTFFFLFQKWKLCQMPKLKKDSTLVELDVFWAMFCGL